jgi:hypothetical protein
VQWQQQQVLVEAYICTQVDHMEGVYGHERQPAVERRYEVGPEQHRRNTGHIVATFQNQSCRRQEQLVCSSKGWCRSRRGTRHQQVKLWHIWWENRKQQCSPWHSFDVRATMEFNGPYSLPSNPAELSSL